MNHKPADQGKSSQHFHEKAHLANGSLSLVFGQKSGCCCSMVFTLLVVFVSRNGNSVCGIVKTSTQPTKLLARYSWLDPDVFGKVLGLNTFICLKDDNFWLILSQLLNSYLLYL